jgi:hypothetical protein
MSCLKDNRKGPIRPAQTEKISPTELELLLAAERAVDVGARIFGQGRAHLGALIAKGDRDFAWAVWPGVSDSGPSVAVEISSLAAAIASLTARDWPPPLTIATRPWSRRPLASQTAAA